jgi:ABC-type cobalt transport system substrate-binding protein
MKKSKDTNLLSFLILALLILSLATVAVLTGSDMQKDKLITELKATHLSANK